MPDLPEDYLGRLTDKVYLAAVLVILVMDRSLSPHYWTYVGDRSLPFLGIIEHTNFIPPEHYGDAHIAYLTNYLERDDPLYQHDAGGAVPGVRAAPAEDQPRRSTSRG